MIPPQPSPVSSSSYKEQQEYEESASFSVHARKVLAGNGNGTLPTKVELCMFRARVRSITLLCSELWRPGRCGGPSLSSAAAGLQVLLANYPAEFLGEVLVLAEDPVQRAALVRDLEVETVRSAAAPRPPPARGLKCHKNE